MAIARYSNLASWVVTTANQTVTLPSYAAGYLGMIFYGTKPYSDSPTIDQGWSNLGSYTSGTNGSGIDTGSMQVRIFWKILGASETNPTITNTTNSVSCTMCYVWQPTSGYSFVTPTVTGGADTTAGTALSITGADNLSLAANDVLAFIAAFNTDASGNISSSAFSASGCTFGTVSKTPSTDAATSSGQDMGATTCYAAVSTGPSSAAPVYTATATGSVGEAAGMFVRIREEISSEAPFPFMGGGYYGG
jgi:hypothetical protein